MNAITIQATINQVDFPIIQELFEKLKIKTTILEKKEDETEMTKEDFFAMVDRARAGKKHEISREEMRKMLLGN